MIICAWQQTTDPISSNDMDQLINVMAKRRLAIKKLEVHT